MQRGSMAPKVLTPSRQDRILQHVDFIHIRDRMYHHSDYCARGMRFMEELHQFFWGTLSRCATCDAESKKADPEQSPYWGKFGWQNVEASMSYRPYYGAHCKTKNHDKCTAKTCS